MIDSELKNLFEEIRADIANLKLDLILVSHDVTVMREQLDRLERGIYTQTQESIGIAPNTPPPDFLPPELM